MASVAPGLSEYASKYKHVRFERQDGILVVTLHDGDGGSLVWTSQVLLTREIKGLIHDQLSLGITHEALAALSL